MYYLVARLIMYNIFVVLLFCAGVAIAQGQKRGDRGKDGDCPPPTEIQVCDASCDLDFQCTGAEKCCPTSCGGTVCTKAITARKEIHRRGIFTFI